MNKDILDTMITELSVHLWGPKSSSLYHTKSEIKKLAEAYAREYAVRELEALVANHLTDDGVRRYVRLHNFEESITRLKGEA